MDGIVANFWLGSSFRSFIKVKKLCTSHYRDLMKIIPQNTIYLWRWECVCEFDFLYIMGKIKNCWSGGLASINSNPPISKQVSRLFWKIRVKCKIFNLMESWNGKRFPFYMFYLKQIHLYFDSTKGYKDYMPPLMYITTILQLAKSIML